MYKYTYVLYIYRLSLSLKCMVIYIYIYNIHINRIICIYAYIHIQNNMYIYLYISCMYIYHTYILFSRCTSQFLDAHPRWWCPPFQFPGLGLTYGALFGFIVSWHGTVGEQTYDFTEGFFWVGNQTFHGLQNAWKISFVSDPGISSHNFGKMAANCHGIEVHIRGVGG